ncbi:MAG TPA: DUF2177 family protein [Emcibacteraceae bacterium]|nr:DUF2177 family protein [Emcibacteraceae bacterium]
MKFLIAYIVTAVVFLVIDYIWLGFLMKDYFQSQLSHLMAENVNLSIAALFYLFYAAGVVFLCINPAIESGEWTKALINGAILGFLAYGTYDITNMATLREWPVMMSVIDVTWGTALTAFSAVMGYLGVKHLYG